MKHFFVSCAAELAESYAFDWRIALWLRDMMSWTERGASGVPPRPFGPSPTQTFRPFIFAEWSIYFAKRSVDFALAGRHDGLEGALLFGRALSPALSLSHLLSLALSLSLAQESIPLTESGLRLGTPTSSANPQPSTHILETSTSTRNP